MEFEQSFKYVFYDYLTIVDDLTINYGFAAYPTWVGQDYLPAEELNVATGESEWVFVSKGLGEFENYDDFQKELSKRTQSTINYVKNHRVDLHDFYDIFIVKISKRKQSVISLLENISDFRKKIDAGIVNLNYQGLEPLDLIFKSNGINSPQGPPDTAQVDHGKLHDGSKEFFKRIYHSLSKMLLFLEHEKNIKNLQRENLENFTGDSELIELIKKAEFEKLFKELSEHQSYKSDNVIIHLVSRYSSLRKDNQSGIVERGTYNIEMNQIREALLQVILQN